MVDPGDRLSVRPKKDPFLIVSNVALLLFTAGFLWIVITRFQDRISAISLSESRFLTTEWRLLQELKAQTDQQLAQKDQEIADLNSRYLKLVQAKASSSEVIQIKKQLAQAQAERQAIIAREIAQNSDPANAPQKTSPQQATAEQPTAPLSPSQPVPSRQASSQQTLAGQSPQGTAEGTLISELLPATGASALVRILQQEVESLRTQLDDSRLQTGELQAEISAADSQYKSTVGRLSDELSKTRSQVESLSSAITKLENEIQNASTAVAQKATEGRPQPSTDLRDLETWALVRAVVSSPAVRAQYPNLLSALDEYFRAYGLQQRSEGRQEAFSTAESILSPITSGTAGK